MATCLAALVQDPGLLAACSIGASMRYSPKKSATSSIQSTMSSSAGGELVDVLAVDRRDERLVEAMDDVVRDPVALLLAHDDLARELTVVGPLLHHPLQEAGRAHDVRAGLLEEVEELALLGSEQLGELNHGARV